MAAKIKVMIVSVSQNQKNAVENSCLIGHVIGNKCLKMLTFFFTQNETKNKIEAKQYDVTGYGTNQRLDCQDCICTFYQV